MTVSGNQKTHLVTTSLLLAQLVLIFIVTTPIAAESKPAEEKGWDKTFFHFHCPGVKTEKNIRVDENAATNITADDITKPESDTVSFEGNVELTQGLKQISALLGKLNEAQNTFSAKGDVKYQDQYVRLMSQSMMIDFSENAGIVEDVKFQLVNGALRGEAESIVLSENKPLKIYEVGFTSCPPGNESWLLESSDVEIDMESGWGDADNVILWLGKVPVFYLPTISFPIDDRRKSGFLYPSLGNSGRNGFELEAPWYWNIAPDKDATFIARYLSERGLMLGAEYRQLTRHTNTGIFAEYLPSDDKGQHIAEDRYYYRLKTDYYSGDHWRGDLAVSSLSDDDYFYDFGSDLHSSNQNILRRFGQIRFDDEHLSFKGIFSNDRLLHTRAKSYSRLPQLQLSLLYPDGLLGFESNVHMEMTAFRHDHAVEAERFIIAPELSIPMRWLSGYIKPKLKLHYSRYSQDDPLNNLPESVSRSVPIFSIDSGMFFERPFDFSEQSFIQTLEPRLYYLYVPSREQGNIGLFDTTSVDNGVDSLFRENRYSGFDRIGDSNQVSLAITSRFIEQVTGQERLRFTVGKAYYLRDRTVNFAIDQGTGSAIDLGIDRSDATALITNLQFGLSDNWWLEGELGYDESKSRTQKGVLGLQYSSNGYLLNLRHRLNRHISDNGSFDIEQAEFSFVWPVMDNLSFVGRWQQDIINNRTIDSFAGLEYESCCWAARLIGRRYLNIRLDQQGLPVPGASDYNNGIYLEFILKGLTNVGKGLDLRTDIQGYEDRFSY